jgi:signal transduction histidine kinase
VTALAPPPGLACADDLGHAVRAFVEQTEELHRTHRELRREVGRLQEELAEARTRLRRSESLAALGEMAAGIAHEVRNPLASIRLYTQTLGDELARDAGRSELCGKIERSVLALDRVVHDVLLFARRVEARPRLVAVGPLVEQALEDCEALLRPNGIETVLCDTDAVHVAADGALLRRAIGNVVRNAAEAMIESNGPRRRIEIDCDRRYVRQPDGRRAARVVIAVSDTGPGIPHDATERMFNPFFTTRAAGTGLGLAIVDRIIDAHGGEVRVRNAPDGGAVVELCLPPAATSEETKVA